MCTSEPRKRTRPVFRLLGSGPSRLPDEPAYRLGIRLAMYLFAAFSAIAVFTLLIAPWGPFILVGDARILCPHGLDLTDEYLLSSITGGYRYTYDGPPSGLVGEPPAGVYTLIGLHRGQLSMTRLRIHRKFAKASAAVAPRVEEHHAILWRTRVSVVLLASNAAFGTIVSILTFIVLGRRHVMQQFQRRERCLKCGYPLVGLRHPYCPECGTLWDLGPGRGGEETLGPENGAAPRNLGKADADDLGR